MATRNERKYEFRKFLNADRVANVRDFSAKAGKNEMTVADGWSVVFRRDASRVTENAAKDLRDYLFDAMDVSVTLKKIDVFDAQKKRVVLAVKDELETPPKAPKTPGAYVVDIRRDEIRVVGSDDRGLAQGCYYLEDLMASRRAPILPLGVQKREPVFSPRMVHSGWGLDQFPDAHLRAIARAGMDAILVFAKDVDTTPSGYLDFNDLIDRAAAFGIDVYLYSYLKSAKHPKEKDAREYYENSYGRLFAACPGAKGVILVGESCEFPSEDLEHTTGVPRFMAKENAGGFNAGIRPAKPSPGWWPCHDYPQWLEMVRDTVRRHNPTADIVFWTYNWGYAPEKDRIKLIESLPKDITLQVTFEMFDQIHRDGAVDALMDYTITFPGPGKYFASEAAAAKKRGVRLYAMSNTAGRTWDFGTVPYIPVPQQWGKRHDALLAAHKNWGLSGLMESHHYGFFPSIVSELAKWSYWTPRVPADEALAKLAARDFGAEGAPFALRAWRAWSDAIDHCPMTNEDQYGPFRVGPSYPMIFHPDITRTFAPQEIQMPSAPNAHFGGRIVKTFYRPFENDAQSPGGVRFPIEIEALEKALKTWRQGAALMAKAVALCPDDRKDAAEKELGLGEYITNAIRTAIHMKKWWLLNKKLLIESEPKKIERLLRELETLALAEIDNAKATIPLVERDSRLGWEPTMEYMTDREHLEWKIRQVRSVLENEIPTYRKMIGVGRTPEKRRCFS